MFELIHRIPEPWRQLTDVLIAPLAWIPRMQHTLWDFFFAPGPWWLVTGKYIFRSRAWTRLSPGRPVSVLEACSVVMSSPS